MGSQSPSTFVETEIGTLPRDWRVHTIGDTCHLSSGGTPSRTVPEYWADEIPWVKTGEVDYKVITKAEESISRLGLKHSAAKVYPPGTILVAMYGQGVTRGRAGILAVDAAINQACAAITVSDELDRDFLFYVLMASYERIRELGHGANQRNLNMPLLRSVAIPIPPIEEQRAIAAVLRTVQQAKEATEKVVEAVRTLKQSLMRHLFTYGPVPFDKADQIELQDTEIGEIPADWVVVTLGDAAEFLQYGTSKRCDLEPVGNPVLRIPNVIHDVIDTAELKFATFDDDELDKMSLVDGDILFVRTNGRKEYIGRSAVYRGEPPSSLFASYLIRARLLKECVDPDFFQFYATTEAGRSFLSGRATSSSDGKFNINTQILRQVLLPKPTIPVQQEVVEMVKRLERKQRTEEERVKSLGTLFDSLLHELMTGQRRLATLNEAETG